MPEIKLQADARTEYGKGAARRIRRAGKIPAVLAGHGADPMHVSLPGHEVTMALKHANVLFSVEYEGQVHLAIAREVQRNPVRSTIQHVDMQVVRRGEKVTVDVPVVVVGEPFPGTIHLVDAQMLSVEAEAQALPQSIEVDIDGLTAGHQVLAGTIRLPDGVSLLSDPELIVVSVTEPQSEAPTAEAGAEAEGAAAD